MNLQHVSELEKDHFVLNNGEEVPISRRNLSQAKRLFGFFVESVAGKDIFMRRLKMVVYLLILGILSSLLGNVSFAWASTQDKLTITEIYDLDLLSAPLMCPVGSDSFDEIIQAYSDCPLYAVCENENESTEQIPSYDTRSVDVQKEGIYEMTMTLQYDKEMFQLSENYSETYTIPVCISDPEKFEIFPTFTSFHHTTLSFCII